jgi:hypothetical protein
VDSPAETTTGEDPSAGADDHIRIEDGAPTEHHGSVRFSLAWWLSFAIPISIALVAIMGAVVGYYAEVHASSSSGWDNDAQISSTYLSGHVDNALLTGQQAETNHALWQELAEAVGHGTGPAMVTAAEPACANADAGVGSLPAADDTVDCQLAQVFSQYALPGYWEHGNPAEFNMERYVTDWVALANLGRDVAVGQHEAAANDQRHRELRLLWLGMLLAVALAFCTLAQAATHHRWTTRTSRTALLLAIPGWILLVGCGGVLLAWEL